MDAQVKQQIIERVKQANNVLVTVASNPTVDELAACVGLTLLLNRMDKHATAVFSGAIPSTIEFLQPEKTIETNTDSLRDFIISLDKNKADKLRYKVEDKVVRIFITPYRTSLSEKDLVFTQGDFNVEVVLALGIKDRTQIDAAITAHGRILHDATVVSVNAGQGKVLNIGQLNWQDPGASSLCEMVVSISEAFGPGLIDNQMATAFLTGIVAETERFRNVKTTPKVMTMAAQLMAAGANQQLIATKLESPPPPPLAPVKKDAPKPPPSHKPPGQLTVAHKPDQKDSPEVEVSPNEIQIDEQGNLKTAAELQAQINELKRLQEQQTTLPQPAPLPPAPQPTLPPQAAQPPLPIPQEPLIPIPQAPVSTPTAGPQISSPGSYMPMPGPARSGVLPSVRPIPGHHTLLDPSGHQPTLAAPFTANTEPEWNNPYNSVTVDPLAAGSGVENVLSRASAYAPPPQPAQMSAAPTGDVNSARDAVSAALAATPTEAVLPPIVALNAQPVNIDLHPPGPVGTAPAPATNGTPSLNLPNGAAAASTANVPPPPPVPPPLPLATNPGAVVPTYTPPTK
ncbi:hypothetical protein A3F38_00700 [Candidatus Saccharibacteria bacterium RIFCSPHIGHO2_12_FULL_48_21]|nr:MAG: hypothetical protein A3F38_00700 [Candidatus Saccharibacteria bacterium RIFCSPHIGHO2_12_FULL_48_21]